ncbi:MAG TPA: CHAT domain-containing tetratricopeptide repeat protein [Gemmatimonadales bacterium]
MGAAALMGCRAPGDAGPAPPAGAGAIAAPAPDALVEGQSLYARGEYDSASAAFTAAIEAARQNGDRRTEGRALAWRGLAAWRLGRYGDARRDGEAGLAVKRAIADREDLFRSWNALGLLAWNEGRLLDALTLFDSAATTPEATPLDLGKAAGNRALVQVELGEFGAARAGLEQQLAAGRAGKDARVEANALTNLAMLDIRVGSPDGALPTLASARQLYRGIGYDPGEQTALAQLATAYQAMGRLQDAFAAIDTAVQLARRLDQPQDVAANLEVQAQLYRDVGEDRHALALQDEAQKINADLGLLIEQGSSLRNQAQILRSLGQGRSAARAAGQALQVHRSAGATYEELMDVGLLAEIEAEAGDPAAAQQYLGSARGLASHLDARSARAYVALVEARIANQAAEADRALRVLTGAWTDLTGGGYDTEWQAWDLRAEAELQRGRLEPAARSAQEAVAAIERVRGGLSSESQRTGFLAKRVRVYARLVEILLRLGRTEQSFEVADAMRGRALVDHLRGPDSLLARVAGLQARLDELARQPGDTGAGAREAHEQMTRELTRVRLAVATTRGTSPSPGDAILGVSPVRPGLVSAALRQDEALIAYFLAGDRGHAFVVRQAGVYHVELPVAAEVLTARIRLARDVVGTAAAPADARVLEKLHEELIAPLGGAGRLDGARRLVIVPQGALAYLPFAALRDQARRRYLVEDYVLTVLPSAAALPAVRGQRGGATGQVGGTGFAPEPSQLPASRVELEAFRAAVPGAAVVIGDAATEARVREALGQSPIVHIAGHASMNGSSPLFSRVELARGSVGDGSDDGRLEVHELLQLSIRSRLVYLSGCETGLGQTWSTSYRAGEDYATLGQSLLYAGAGSVVATLWRIEDQAAANLASRFYHHLRSAAAPEALARAQRDLLADPRFARPHHWAGHLVIGAPPGRDRG